MSEKEDNHLINILIGAVLFWISWTLVKEVDSEVTGKLLLGLAFMGILAIASSLVGILTVIYNAIKGLWWIIFLAAALLWVLFR